MDISEVVERVRAGDKQAFAIVVTEYQGPLFGYLGRMGLPQAWAEEIAQETFLRAWTELERFDARRGSFTTWLFTIARRLALNALGRQSTRRELGPTGNREAPSDEPQPADALAQAERRALMRAALLELPPAERSVVALVYTRGLALADVARIEGSSLGAIKTRLHRARQKLARRLENALE